MPHPRYDHLDELLTRIHVARQRPEWRRGVLDGSAQVPSVSTLRVLRAVEQCEAEGRGASIGDVAEYLAVEHSTASRMVGSVVAAGLVTKSLAADDQRRCVLVLTAAGHRALDEVTSRRRQMVADVVADWADDDVDALVELLGRLAVDFEAGVRV